MNIFQKLWLKVKAFFQSEEAKKIANLGLQILQITATKYAGELADVAYKAVQQSEREGGSGFEKYEKAFKAVRGALSYDDLKDRTIDTAIHVSLEALSKEIEKRGSSALY